MRALEGYTYSRSDTYDARFAKEIRQLRPDWFDPHRQTRAEADKRTIIAIAKNGEQRPNKGSAEPTERRLGEAIQRHKNKDDDFYKELRDLRPDWFNVPTAITVSEKKRMLLEIARGAGKRPNSRSQNPEERRLESALRRYTGTYNKSYDADFCAEIRKLRPEWFDPNRHQKVIETKQKLLDLAKNGGEKPRKSGNLTEDRLAVSLSYLTNKNRHDMFDPVFDAELRALAPHWFKSRRLNQGRSVYV